MRGTFDRCGLSSNRLSDLAGNMVNNLCWMAVIAGAYYCMGSEISDADVREAQGVPGPTDKEDEPMNKEDDDGDSKPRPLRHAAAGLAPETEKQEVY